MQLKPDHRIWHRTWQVWISSGIVEGGFVVDDPNRPTENQALRNVRDAARERYTIQKLRQYGRRKNVA